MRPFLIILLLVIGVSCKTNHYMSAPAKNIPNIGLQNDLKSNGILIASDYNLKADTASFENCLEGLRVNVEAMSEVNVIDEIFFLRKPNTSILSQLKTKYNVNGLLLLTKLKVQNQCVDIPNGQFEYMDNRMPEPHLQISKSPIMWTNISVEIISYWEYHDFATGKSYTFKIKSDKVLETKQYVSDIDLFFEANLKLLDSLYYLNGSLTASNLIGLND